MQSTQGFPSCNPPPVQQEHWLGRRTTRSCCSPNVIAEHVLLRMSMDNPVGQFLPTASSKHHSCGKSEGAQRCSFIKCTIYRFFAVKSGLLLLLDNSGCHRQPDFCFPTHGRKLFSDKSCRVLTHLLARNGPSSLQIYLNVTLTGGSYSLQATWRSEELEAAGDKINQKLK